MAMKTLRRYKPRPLYCIRDGNLEIENILEAGNFGKWQVNDPSDPTDPPTIHSNQVVGRKY